MEVYLGEIKMFAGNFAPRGFALCNGQLLSISQNAALFSILGTTYGGNGTTTFALPNLQGRLPMHFGNGPGLTPRVLGEEGGEESVTLLTSQMPAHTHMLAASTAPVPDAPSPENNFNGITTDPNSGSSYNTYNTTKNAAMNPAAISITGGSLPHDNMPPFQCVNFIIALTGIFPSRN